MCPKLHRLMLDYDLLSKEEIEADAKRLNVKYNLGGYEVEPSDTTDCWHTLFPKTAFSDFGRALEIAYDSKCDKDWLRFVERYKIFALKTELVKGFQPHARRKVRSRPVKEIMSPFILIVKPKTELDMKRVVKLSESTQDHTWIWKVTYPIIGIYEDRETIGEVHIGCKSNSQALGRIRFIKKLEIDADYEVKSK